MDIDLQSRRHGHAGRLLTPKSTNWPKSPCLKQSIRHRRPFASTSTVAAIMTQTRFGYQHVIKYRAEIALIEHSAKPADPRSLRLAWVT